MDGSPAQLQDKVIFGKGIFYFGGNRGRGQARKPGQVWQVGQGSKEKVIPSGNLKYGKRNPPFEQLIFTFKTPLRADFPIVVHGFPMIFLSKPSFHWGISSHLSFPEGEQIPRIRPSSLGLRLVDLMLFFGAPKIHFHIVPWKVGIISPKSESAVDFQGSMLFRSAEGPSRVAGLPWGQPEQQQPVLGIRHRHHLRHRWFEGLTWLGTLCSL